MGRSSLDLKTSVTNGQVTFWLFLALLGTSIEPVLVKYFNPPISPFGLIVLKSIAGSILMSPLYGRLRKLPLKNMLPILWVSALAFGTNGLVFLSLIYIPATVVVTIITTTPLLVAIVHHLRGTTKLTPFFIFSFLIVITGVILTIRLFEGATYSWSNMGILIAFTAVITSAFYRLSMEGLTRQIRPLDISCGIFLTNGIVSILFLPMVDIPTETITFGAWLGLAGAIANISFLLAIKHLGAIRVSMLSLIQRPLAVITGAFLLKENLSQLQQIGILLIFVGIFLEKLQIRFRNRV